MGWAASNLTDRKDLQGAVGAVENERLWQAGAEQGSYTRQKISLVVVRIVS